MQELEEALEGCAIKDFNFNLLQIFKLHMVLIN